MRSTLATSAVSAVAAAHVLVPSDQTWMNPAAAPCWIGVALLVGGQRVVVQRPRRAPSHDRARPAEEPHPGLAGDRRGGLVHECLERLAKRRKPQAVVDQLRVAQSASALCVCARSRWTTSSSTPVGRQQQRRGGHLVDLAALDADQPVLDHVDPADAVRAGERAGPLDQRRAGRSSSPSIATGTPCSNAISTTCGAASAVSAASSARTPPRAAPSRDPRAGPPRCDRPHRFCVDRVRGARLDRGTSMPCRRA